MGRARTRHRGHALLPDRTVRVVAAGRSASCPRRRLGLRLDQRRSRHATIVPRLPEPFAFTTGTLPELLIIDPILSGAVLALAAWIVDPAWLQAQRRA